MTTTTPAPAEALSEPRRIRRELLDSFPMPRECSVCGCHKTLDIEYVCGGCRDDEYLGEWQRYARAQAARAQAAEAERDRLLAGLEAAIEHWTWTKKGEVSASIVYSAVVGRALEVLNAKESTALASAERGQP